MPAKFKRGFAHVLFLVLMAGLAVGVVTFSEAGKNDSRKISAGVACAANPNSKDCQNSIPKNPKVDNLPKKCSDKNYNVELEWKNKSAQVTVDISQDPNFVSFASKTVKSDDSTKAPKDFNNSLTLEPDKTYYWRIWYGLPNTWVQGPSFTVPFCRPQPTTPSPTPTPTPIPPIGDPIGKLTVIAPNGGESYKEGDSVTIRWNWVGGFSGATTPEFHTLQIIDNTTGTGPMLAIRIPGYEYNWTVPSNLPAGAYKIRVSAGNYIDQSDSYFKITPNTAHYTLDLKANGSDSPPTVVVNSNVTLSWKSVFPSADPFTACTASGAWSGTKKPDGSEVVMISSSFTNNYTLTCYSSSQQVAKSDSVTVNMVMP